MLVLDEPTNNLDLESVAALADAVSAVPGGVVLVSHDQTFVSRVRLCVGVCMYEYIRSDKRIHSSLCLCIYTYSFLSTSLLTFGKRLNPCAQTHISKTGAKATCQNGGNHILICTQTYIQFWTGGERGVVRWPRLP